MPPIRAERTYRVDWCHGVQMMLNEIEQYREYLSRLPVSPHTRRNYLGRVKLYLGWLSGSPGCEKALLEPVERDFAVHDYKVSLLQLGRSIQITVFLLLVNFELRQFN